MTSESHNRSEAFRDLLDQSLGELDPATLSPLYVELRSLQDRYVQPELIAVGGMKRVLKVLDRQSNRHVAMARLHEDADDLLFDPFIREGRLTALLEHPNVISVYDVGVDSEGQPFFTMELKVGDGLDVILKKALAGDGYPLAERLEVFLKVCDAITYAHSRQVIHLDLKPANVQVGRFGEVLVCDWGLGKLIGNFQEIVADDVLLNPDLLNEMTMAGKVKGTPGYMAPEQINGEPKDERTDVYALGALLYAVLTCRPPVDGNTESMLESTVAGDIIPPEKRDPNVPASLSAVVMKAMAVAPKDRYASVSALVTDVRAFLGGYSPVAHESGLTDELVLFYQRHRAVCNVAAGFLAVVVVVTALFVERLGVKRAQAEELAARLQIEKQESETLLNEVGVLASPFRADVNDEEMLRNGKQISDDFFFQAPLVSYKLSLRSLNEVIRSQPENRNEARGQLGFLYFLALDFEKAQPALAADPKYLNGLSRVNDDLLATFDHDEHQRSGLQLSMAVDRVVSRLNRRILAEKMLAYDYASIGYREGYHLAVDVLLQRINGTLDFDPTGGTVTLRRHDSDNFTKIVTASGLTPLRFLPVKRLVFADTDVQNGSDLNGLANLEFADLRGSRIDSLPAPETLPKLRAILIRPGQFSDDAKAELPPRITLTEQELAP